MKQLANTCKEIKGKERRTDREGKKSKGVKNGQGRKAKEKREE